jgi:hypothetical protein
MIQVESIGGEWVKNSAENHFFSKNPFGCGGASRAHRLLDLTGRI